MPSLYEDLEKIPCFKSTFMFSICSGLGAGLACFIFTSRIKRSTDVAVATFAVTTVAKFIHCRYHWTKEHFSSAKFQDTLRTVIEKEETTESTNPVR